MQFTERQKAILAQLKGPATPLLGMYGIKVRLGAANKEYLNLSHCPWCGHGEVKGDNWECGVRETAKGDGYMHSFKCHHSHKSPDGDDTPHYADVLARLGVMTEDEAHWVKNLRAEIERQATASKLRPVGTELRSANDAFRERLTRRLKTNQVAMDWLTTTRGFSPAVVEHFSLGLSEPYQPKESKEVLTVDALTAPLRGSDGKFYSKYVNYTVPGVTVDNREKPLKSWSAGPARTYYGDKASGKKHLFVCDGLKDLWAIWDKIHGTDLGKSLVLVTSTNGGGGFPEEWRVPAFWDEWETVYLGHDNDQPNPKTGKKAGDEHAKSLARLAMREMRRVWPVGYKDWNDFFLAGKTAQDFEQVLQGAYPLSLKELVPAAVDDRGPGFHAAAPVAVAGNFHNGHLYDAVDVLERVADDETGQLMERYRTVVVRSDGTLHSVATMPAPKGTKTSQLVHRLVPDGSLLDGPVKPSPYSSWNWNSIQDFVQGRAKQKDLSELLTKIIGHLKASVWLPFSDDYTLLGCAVVATYVQSIFDAVPLLLANGAAGTGKTALGIAMSEVAANSPKTAVGQISAASIARLIDQSRGFVVLDDLESIGGRRNGDAQFDELIQSLKLSYNKQSAIKYWTNMKTGVLEKLNFFGIKLINNTRGVDSILGSRMFTIATRKMPEGYVLSTEGELSPEARVNLRNDLHTWAFMNAQSVSQAYSFVFPNKTTRSDEISAPLKVVALLAASKPEIATSLDAALARQSRLDVLPETSEQVLREALEDIIAKSFTERGVVRTVVTITELMMRMALMVDANYGKASTTDLSDIESPEYVGRQIKQNYVQDGAEQIRVQMFGKYLRGYELDTNFVNKVLVKHAPEALEGAERISDPRDFCRGCGACDYRTKCDMRVQREARDGVSVVRVQAKGGRPFPH